MTEVQTWITDKLTVIPDENARYMYNKTPGACLMADTGGSCTKG